MERSNWICLLRIAALLNLILVFAASSAPSGNLTAHFLDVGQGDSELIQFAGKNILIDGGEQDMGPRVSSYLREHGVKNLDLVIATHPHSDHIGGLLTVLNDFLVKQILDSGQASTSQVYENFLTLIDRKNIPYKIAERGQTINLDPKLKIEVLSPPKTPFSDDLNQNSIVIRVTYGMVSFLFMGDAGFEAEDSIMAAGYDLKSTVLKVGHHGSSSSTGTTFLSKVQPEVEIIEVGTGNDYGHPAKKTLSALQRTSSTTYRTDINGNIVITTDGTSYSISTQKLSSVPVSTAPQAKTLAYTPTTTSSSSLATSSTTASGGPLVGSSKSNKYHYPSCSGAKKIASANLVTFSGSAEARAKGYEPCGICHPP
jgi:beta-lactamase superfamily II metal-dependent hydrolase